VNGRLVRWLLTLARRPGLDHGGRGTQPRLIVLRHHRVFADGERPLDRLGVSESVFRAQLAMLGSFGLTPVTVAEGLAHLDSGVSGARVALSFDDGYADNHGRALPLLQAAQARATFYLTAGLMEAHEAPWWDVVSDALERTRASELVWSRGGTEVRLPLGGRGDRARALAALLPDFRAPLAVRSERLETLRRALGIDSAARCDLMGWPEAAALRDAGMEIGAHTMTHPHLSVLDPVAQRSEIADSVALIERRIGVRASGLAYPGGDHDAHTVDAARAAGLTYAVTTRSGENGPATPRFELRRRGMPDGACLDPQGRFAPRLAMAEIEGAFDGLRASRAGAPS